MKRCLLFVAAFMLLSGPLSNSAIACCITNVDIHCAVPEAYDFKVVLDKTRQVEWHFDGYHDAPHFHAFKSWIQNIPERTFLKWYDPYQAGCDPGPIVFCDTVHLGWELDGPARIRSACWTDADQNCIGYTWFPGHWVRWDNINEGIVQLSFANTNDEPGDVTVSNIYYAIFPVKIPLDSLNALNPALDPVNMTLLDGGSYTLSQGEAKVFYINGINPGDWVVYRFESGTEVRRVFGEHQMEPVDIPTHTQWGLIILLVILAGIATWVVLKRRRVVTA